MKIDDIYVRKTECLLQEININWCRKSNQHSMLAYPVFNRISIYTYKGEIFLTFMLEDDVYI